MTKIVISQPMFFPWVGLFEQVRLADVYVHYDDVQFSKGSFTNRVQIKTGSGIKWLTLPVTVHLGDRIKDVRLAPGEKWRQTHLAFLEQAFFGATHAPEALKLVESVYAAGGDRLVDVVMNSMHAVIDYFDLAPRTRFLHSSTLGIDGHGWERVLSTVKRLEGDHYITGHGARHYLAHEAFEAAGVTVEYLDYERRPYPQLHGPFTPYVSVLDLVANCGRAGRQVIASRSIPWRQFLGTASGTAQIADGDQAAPEPRRPSLALVAPPLTDPEPSHE